MSRTRWCAQTQQHYICVTNLYVTNTYLHVTSSIIKTGKRNSKGSRIALHCNTLHLGVCTLQLTKSNSQVQCVADAVCCSVLQCVDVRCDVWQGQLLAHLLLSTHMQTHLSVTNSMSIRNYANWMNLQNFTNSSDHHTRHELNVGDDARIYQRRHTRELARHTHNCNESQLQYVAVWDKVLQYDVVLTTRRPARVVTRENSFKCQKLNNSSSCHELNESTKYESHTCSGHHKR